MARFLILCFAFCFLFTQCRDATPPPKTTEPSPSSPSPEMKPSSPIIQGIGKTDFKITTNSKDAQLYFNQGVSLLHCFWFNEALISFRHAAQLDPDCAMAYWGIYQSQKGQETNSILERATALLRAKSYLPNLSEREKLYIRAVEHFFSPSPKRKESRYAKVMTKLVKKYPNDVDAQLFLALFLREDYDPDGHPKPGTKEALRILRKLLKSHPDKLGVHHYFVHTVESGPNPGDALKSAIKLPKLGPGSGHIVHMPGHIFYLTGEFEKARNAFLRGFEADSSYMNQYKVGPQDYWNYVHNLNYLVANCAEDGRYKDGLRWAKKLQDVPVSPKHPFIFFQGHLATSRIHMRYGYWKKAAESLINLSSNPKLSEFEKDYIQGKLLYTQTMSLLAENQIRPALAKSRKLSELLTIISRKNYIERKDQANAKKMSRTLMVDFLALHGTSGSFIGRHRDAITFLKEAVLKETLLGYSEPPQRLQLALENLGNAYMKMKKWKLARKSYQTALKKRPKSGMLQYRFAQTYQYSGEIKNAKKAYQLFLKHWKFADDNLQPVIKAKKWLKDNS